MNEKTFIGLFDREEALTSAVEELDKKGIEPEDMYIIAKKAEDVEIFRRRTFEDIQSAPSNWLDRFIGYITGENHVRSMLVDVGFDEADLRKYEAQIKEGKWLLYVEGEPKKTAYETNAERYQAETNPFNYHLSEAERLNRRNDDPIGVGKDGLPKNEYRDSVLSDVDNTNADVYKHRRLGMAGAEALYDKTKYEPTNADHQSQPSLVRGTPQRERQHLHILARQERNHDTTLQQSEASHDDSTHTTIPYPNAIMESQMDRQDAMAETTDQTQQSYNHIPTGSNHNFEDINASQEPIIIDLRGVKKNKNDVENWLIQDEEDLEK